MKDYLDSAIKQFRYYKMLGEKTFLQVGDEQLFISQDEENNSIAVIVQHLFGNMMSRWTNFLTSDGEKDWRRRDDEFVPMIKTRVEMMKMWEEGWVCLFNALSELRADDLDKIVYIRNQEHSVTEAINRQLAHYPYHIGQIVLIGKQFAGNKWNSLSIPRNTSAEYKKQKFGPEKKRGHFTDEFLKGDDPC